MLPWRPASPYEELLEQAYRAGDIGACLALLRRGHLALPIGEAAVNGTGPPAWPTARAGDMTFLVAYTSPEAMATITGTEHCRVAMLPELAAGWPDTRWGLAVNAGLDVHLELESGTVARLAVPGLAENRSAYPDALPPVMQKVLSGRETEEIMAGRRRISGYVHQLLDVQDADSSGELLEALGESDDMLSPYGSVTVLRWTAVGSALYRTPYGGTDDERRAAVSGWVVEEPPFCGLGLGRNVDRVVREYKVDGVGLPAGAQLWEIADDGDEQLRAVLDPVPDPWWSYRARRHGTEQVVSLEAERDRVEVVDADGKRVPAADCDQVDLVTTVGEWRGQPCQVQDQRGYELLVEYTGGRAPVATALGFARVERGVHRSWVPRAGMRDLREHRQPLDV